MNKVIEYTPKTKIQKKAVQRKSSIQFLPQILSEFSQKEFFEFNEKKLKSAYLIDITHTLILKYYFRKENLFNLSSIVLKDRYGYLYNYYIKLKRLQWITLLNVRLTRTVNISDRFGS